MTQPTPSPAAAAKVFLGTGAYGDPGAPDLSRQQFVDRQNPAAKPGPSAPAPTPEAGWESDASVPQDSTPVTADVPSTGKPAPAGRVA